MRVISPDNFTDSSDVKSAPLGFLPKFAMSIAGFAVLAFAFIGRSELGDSRSSVLVPVALGSGLIVTGLAIGSRWQGAAFWFSIAVIGQVLSFQIINAGPQLRYQHYKPLGELIQFPSAWYLGAIGLQLVLVIVGMWRVFPKLVAWVRENLRPWQAVLLALCFFLPTTTVSPNPVTYVSEFILAGFVQLLALATVVVFAAKIPNDFVRRVGDAVRRISESNYRSSYLYVTVAALFVTLLAIVLNILSYQQHPHIPDEVAYLIQAKLFAAGAVGVQAPPVPEAFDVYLLKVSGGLWYPVTPPGWPLLLSLGAFVGAPLIVNPILGGLNIVLCYQLVTRLYSFTIAGASMLLLAISPWFVFLAMSYMTHMSALTCLLLAAIGVVKAREGRSWKWALLSGMAIGFLSTIRPLEAVAVAGLIGLWAMGVGGKRLNFVSLAGIAFGTLLLGSIGLAFNGRLTGEPLTFPINLYTDETFGKNSNAYGFGPDRGMGWQLDPYPGHGPIDALVNTNLNVSALNTELLGWSIGSFLMIGAFLCFGKMRTSDYLMLAIIGVIYVLHFFYYFSGGPDFGARYWFLMIVPLIVLTVRGIESLASKLGELETDSRNRLFASLGALVIITLAVFIPWRAIDKYRDFRGMTPDVRELNEEFRFGRSLVLIRGEKHPEYDSAFVYNTIDLAGDQPIYAWDRDADTRRRLLETYSDRPVWIIAGPSVTGDHFRVTSGPTPASEILGEQAN